MATSVDDNNEELENEIKNLMQNSPVYPPTHYENILSYIDQHSITARMFRNEYLNSKDSSVMKGKTARPVLVRKENASTRTHTYYVPLPRNRSLFSVEEMNELYCVYDASLHGAPLTPTQQAVLAKSAQNLKIENAQFAQLVRKVWLDESWKRRNVVKPEVYNFVSAWWKARLSRVKNYPSTYKQISSIPLTPLEDEVNLDFVEEVFSFGKPSRFYTSSHNNLCNGLSIITLTKGLLKGQCIREKLKENLTNAPLLDVSRDPLAEKFAIEHQAQLVLTPSVLAVILSNNPLTYEEDWTLPFCIKDFTVGDHSYKIIFIDKKLPPKSLTPVEKNGIFSKVATKTLFRKPQRSWTQLENSEDGFSSGEEIPKEDESPLPEVRVRKQVKYNLWECQSADDHSVLSKHHRKPFKILIKTSIKHKAIDSKLKKKPCVVSSKLDYQPEYGAEISSFREITSEFIGLMMHRDAILHRVRIDPMKGTTVMVQEKNIAQLAIDCHRLHSRTISSQLSIIQNLFDNICTLPVGNYVLNHQVKDMGFMVVFQEQKNSSRMDLNLTESYAAVNLSGTAEPTSATAPWVPIDTTVITPTFHYLRRVPCVFPPSKNDKMKRQKAYDERPRLNSNGGCFHEGASSREYLNKKTNSKKKKNKNKKTDEKNMKKNNSPLPKPSGSGTNDDRTAVSYEDLCQKMLSNIESQKLSSP